MKFVFVFLIWPMLAFSSTPNCGPSISPHALQVATASEVAQNINENEIRDNLERLTGRKALFDRDNEFCMGDRCSSSHRVLTRSFLISKLLDYGFSPENILIESEGTVMSLRQQAESDGQISPRFFRLVTHNGPVNIIGVIKAVNSSKDVVEIVAHYDTAGSKVPGADDNGSGVVTALEAARTLNEGKFKPQRSVRIVFDDLEERGMGGSRLHAKNVKAEVDAGRENFVGAIVVDMIGYFPSDSDGKYVVEAGSDWMHSGSPKATYDFANAILDQLRSSSRLAKADPLISGAAPSTADHGPYWGESLPAVLISTIFEAPFITPGYHSPKDKIETMNWSFFRGVLGDIVESLAHVAQVQPSQSVEAKVRARVNPALTPVDHIAAALEADRSKRRRSWHGYDDYESSWSSPSNIKPTVGSFVKPNGSQSLAAAETKPKPEDSKKPEPVVGASSETFWGGLLKLLRVDNTKKKVINLSGVPSLLKYDMTPLGLVYSSAKNLDFRNPALAEFHRNSIDTTAEIIYSANFDLGGTRTPRIRVGKFMFKYDTRGDTLTVEHYNPALLEGGVGYVFATPKQPNANFTPVERFASLLSLILDLNRYVIPYSEPYAPTYLTKLIGGESYSHTYYNGDNFTATFQVTADGIKEENYGYTLPIRETNSSGIAVITPRVQNFTQYLLKYGLDVVVPNSAHELRGKLKENPAKTIGPAYKYQINYGTYDGPEVKKEVAQRLTKGQRKKARRETKS